MASCFLRAYERSMSDYTDAAPIFHTASAVTVFGALLTRYKYRVVLEGGVPPRWSNLWTVIVAGSGQRKSTAVRMAEEVLMRVDSSLLAPSDGSPEGFLSHMSRRHRESTNNSSTFFVSPEFSMMLMQFQRSYSSVMKPLLMDLYDVPPIFKRNLAKSSFEIPQPRVSILGAIATELMPSLTTQDDWLGGFFSRCMLITGEPVKKMKFAKTPPDEVYKEHADALFECLKAWRSKQKTLGIGSKRPFMNYSSAGLKEASKLPDAPDEPTLQNSLSRASVHLMKCAVVEQIDEDPYATSIGPAATKRALEYVMKWWDGIPELIDTCFSRGRQDFEGDRLPKRVAKYVQTSGGLVTYAQAMMHCALDSRKMSDAIRSLQEAGLVQMVSAEDLGKKALCDGMHLQSIGQPAKK